MSTIKTPYRIIHPLTISELEAQYSYDRNSLPRSMEILPDGVHVVIYLSKREFKNRQGEIFPKCPITGALCYWDSDYNSAMMELF